MGFQEVPGVAEVRLVYSQTGNTQSIESVFHFLLQPDWSDTELSDLLDGVSASWTTNLRQAIGISQTLQDLYARDLTGEFANSVSLHKGQAGTENSQMASANNCPVVSFQCGGAGAPKRGWYFHPFVAEVNVLNTGKLDTGVAAQLAGYVEDFFEDIEAAAPNPTHVVVSRYHNKVLRDPGVYNEVTSYLGRDRVGSQRNRRTKS